MSYTPRSSDFISLSLAKHLEEDRRWDRGLSDIRGHYNAFQVLLVIGAQFMSAIKTEARKGGNVSPEATVKGSGLFAKRSHISSLTVLLWIVDQLALIQSGLQGPRKHIHININHRTNICSTPVALHVCLRSERCSYRK